MKVKVLCPWSWHTLIWVLWGSRTLLDSIKEKCCRWKLPPPLFNLWPTLLPQSISYTLHMLSLGRIKIICRKKLPTQLFNHWPSPLPAPSIFQSMQNFPCCVALNLSIQDWYWWWACFRLKHDFIMIRLFSIWYNMGNVLPKKVWIPFSVLGR